MCELERHSNKAHPWPSAKAVCGLCGVCINMINYRFTCFCIFNFLLWNIFHHEFFTEIMSKLMTLNHKFNYLQWYIHLIHCHYIKFYTFNTFGDFFSTINIIWNTVLGFILNINVFTIKWNGCVRLIEAFILHLAWHFVALDLVFRQWIFVGMLRFVENRSNNINGDTGF